MGKKEEKPAENKPKPANKSTKPIKGKKQDDT
jgi:hypothetical protein